ncbi:hypothetical protein MTP99_015376 [Tenebrio molitor]|nr:hypothetical protein MTP99_015376 [Tenebrio molitor]
MGRNVQVCASSRTKSSLERMIKRTRIQQMTVKLKEGFHGHAFPPVVQAKCGRLLVDATRQFDGNDCGERWHFREIV